MPLIIEEYWPWLVPLGALIAIGYACFRGPPSQSAIDSWESFWKMYDNLINELRSSQKMSIAGELAEAKGFVNGLSDGWHDLESELERILEAYKGDLDDEELKALRILLSALKRAISNR